MNLDKYIHIAVRNPEGCRWYAYLDQHWEDVAQRLREAHVFEKYTAPDGQIVSNLSKGAQLSLVQQIVGLTVWSLGFSQWYSTSGGPPTKVNKGQIRLLLDDLGTLGRHFNKNELRTDKVPLEIWIIDQLLEKWRSKIF